MLLLRMYLNAALGVVCLILFDILYSRLVFYRIRTVSLNFREHSHVALSVFVCKSWLCLLTTIRVNEQLRECFFVGLGVDSYSTSVINS